MYLRSYLKAAGVARLLTPDNPEYWMWCRLIKTLLPKVHRAQSHLIEATKDNIKQKEEKNFVNIYRDYSRK